MSAPQPPPSLPPSSPAAPSRTPGAGSGLPSPTGLAVAPGTPFAGYVLEDALGRGAFGVVYRARQQRPRREVAIKVIAARDARLVERFEREVDALAALSHPSIVTIFESGLVDGHLFYAMELLPGGSLREALRHGPLPPAEAIEHVATVAEALHAAHQAGILHRDIKPSNVLLSADGRAKLADFGVARPLDGGSSLTETGAVVGTPAYVAPEQLGAGGGAADRRSDVYALGVLLFELLTGRPPFAGESPAELYRRILEEPPPSARAVDRSVPVAADRVLLRAMAKAPEDRPATALDVARALRSGGVPAAGSAGRAGGSFVTVAVIAAVALAAAASGAAAMVMSGRDRSGGGASVPRAPAALTATERLARREARAAARSTPSPAPIDEAGASSAAAPPAATPPAAAPDARASGPAPEIGGLLDASVDALRRGELGDPGGVLSSIPPELVDDPRVLCLRGAQLAIEGRADEAIGPLGRIPDGPVRGVGLFFQGRALLALDRAADAVAAFAEALEHEPGWGANDIFFHHANTAGQRHFGNGLGTGLMSAAGVPGREPAKAVGYFALLCGSNRSNSHHNRTFSLCGLAEARFATGDADGARAALDGAIAADPSVFHGYRCRAGLHLLEARYVEALADARRALALPMQVGERRGLEELIGRIEAAQRESESR